MSRSTGFIALDRRIFDHWVAQDPRVFFAWVKLIHGVRYKPGRVDGIYVDRAEMIFSVRALAKDWSWSKSAVDRFLKRLQRDEMIDVRRAGTVPGTVGGTGARFDTHILKLCNYDRFHPTSENDPQLVGQEAGQEPGQHASQPSLFADEKGGLKPSKPSKQKKAKGEGPGEGKRAVPSAPRHGARSTQHGTVYVHSGTEDWRVFSEDYRNTMRAEPLPDRHGGFWFYALGEAARPKHQRTWRRRA